jgi:hypothetical protein
MAMGRRQPRQEALWVATDTLRPGGGVLFEVLCKHDGRSRDIR